MCEPVPVTILVGFAKTKNICAQKLIDYREHPLSLLPSFSLSQKRPAQHGVPAGCSKDTGHVFRNFDQHQKIMG